MRRRRTSKFHRSTRAVGMLAAAAALLTAALPAAAQADDVTQSPITASDTSQPAPPPIDVYGGGMSREN